MYERQALARAAFAAPSTKENRMEKSEVLKRIAEVGLVPVIRAESKDEALRVVEAIGAGGVPVLEITMTVPGALSVIEAIRRQDPKAIVGAGTVLDPETARQEPAMLRAVVRERGKMAGIYGTTEALGPLAVGDELWLSEERVREGKA